MTADPDLRHPRSPALVGLGAVRQAWRETRGAEPRGERLAAALRAFAREGREAGMPVSALLRALDGLVRRDDGEPGFERVREWAGSQLIRAYFRSD